MLLIQWPRSVFGLNTVNDKKSRLKLTVKINNKVFRTRIHNFYCTHLMLVNQCQLLLQFTSLNTLDLEDNCEKRKKLRKRKRNEGEEGRKEYEISLLIFNFYFFLVQDFHSFSSTDKNAYIHVYNFEISHMIWTIDTNVRCSI